MKLEDYLRREETEYTIFRIIPHTSNLNSTTRKLQNSLYELFSYRHTKYPWQRVRGIEAFKKSNLYLTIKEAPKLWWVVHMVEEESDPSTHEAQPTQRIEFYVVVPKEFKEPFKTKFSNHEQWKRATLEEADKPFNNQELENTDLYNVKYTRSDMFSLNHDYTQQHTPIRDIMTVSRELSPAEGVTLFVQAESVPRKKWKKLSDYSWDVWNKGRVPSKPGLDPSMLINDIGNLLMIGIHQVKGIIDDILAGVSKSLFHDDDYKRKQATPKTFNAERESLLVNGDLSNPTKKKRNKPVFKTNILYTVTSKDEVKRDMLARSMSNAFNDLKGDNFLKPIKININTKKEIETVRNFKLDLATTNLMSIDEVGKLMQLPTSDLQREFEESLESNKRVEIELDKELLDSKGILAGSSTNRGETHNIHIQTKNRDLTSTARVFIGSPRMGKDQAAINLVVESKRKHNMGAVVLDVINEQNGHRGMADAIRDHLPPEDIIDLNLMDTENPIYLGLEPITKLISDSRIASDRIAEELCSFLLSDGDEDKLRTVEHLREAAKLTNADILSIKHMFTSESFRAKVIEQKKHIFDTDIWEHYNKLSDGQQQSIYTPVMRRIGQIMSSEFMKPIFAQRPNPNLDLFKFLSEGKVVIFRMKSGLMSQRVIEILSYWIVLVTFLVKLAQDGNSKSNNGTILVLNEPHQYLTPNLAHFIERIFAEGPKYRLTPLLIFHNFTQFKKFPGFVDMMKSSSLNWHIFKNTNEDVYKELYQGYLSRTFDSPTQAFEATRIYQYIGIFLDSKGAYYDPFVADALPLISDRYQTMDNSKLTLQHSKVYGRPINEVLEGIRERNREAMKQLARK